MHIRNSCPARAYYRILEKFILPGLMRLSIAPNHFTFVGLVLAIFVPFGFYVHPVLGFIFIILSGIADSIDGMMARNHGMDTNFGSFLDSSIDRISDFFYLFGFWTLFWNYERIILASSLVFLSFLFTAMISYVKAKAKELSYKCEVGIMERGFRTVYLIIWALLLCIFPSIKENILWMGLIIYCIMTMLTVTQRIIYIKCQSK